MKRPEDAAPSVPEIHGRGELVLAVSRSATMPLSVVAIAEKLDVYPQQGQLPQILGSL
jgi:hypothetical protein